MESRRLRKLGGTTIILLVLYARVVLITNRGLSKLALNDEVTATFGSSKFKQGHNATILPRDNITEESHNSYCALLFFGLPRQFKDIAYPSIKKHIVEPNQNCNIFIHAYNVTQAFESRDEISNGTVDIGELELLTSAIDKSHVLLETEEDFLDQRDLAYFRQFHPKPSAWDYPSSIDNMIRQWHSIEGAWKTMNLFEEKNEMRFSRVGLFRIDLKYEDTVNVETSVESAVIPNMMYDALVWGGVNDRIFYGRRYAAEIWATDRFTSVKEYISWQESNLDYKGKSGLHSEDFLRYLLLHKSALLVKEKPLCFKRVRSDGTLKQYDCQFMHQQMKKIKRK